MRFVVGDALRLLFPDAGVDVVVNIESSHCYPSMTAFLTEVDRVLRPGGCLVLADFRSAEDLPALEGTRSFARLTTGETRSLSARLAKGGANP